MPGLARGGSLSLGRFYTELLADLLPLFRYKFHIRISKMEWGPLDLLTPPPTVSFSACCYHLLE